MVTEYVKVLWRVLRRSTKLRRMNHAVVEADFHHEFVRAGRRYRWVEGALHPAAARFRGRRAELAGLLHRSVAPSQERRGATREQLPATDDGRAWWVTWRRPGEAAVWALYVSTRGLDPSSARLRGAPANDGALLAAWGDGPVLAWASEEHALREALRDALRAVPEFLSEGVCSADETFAVRLTAA